ncbi:hypothetical protein Y032_0025g1281 [Ancylostoma ceylanicum]|uniref:Uncharacterized protein n=1 Tax=Ancylostoma ceylanicum TaxID=53326 RepID=A0A016UVN7_9BILA|nr:hypothetical protein Y032_0025g1281 [Ancylostoma ceylanicum]
MASSKNKSTTNDVPFTSSARIRPPSEDKSTRQPGITGAGGVVELRLAGVTARIIAEPREFAEERRL